MPNWLWALTVVPVTTLVPAMFPDGRALSPRWRPVLWLGWVVTIATAAVNAVGAGPGAEQVAGTGWAVAGVASFVALAVRWKRADGPGRQQLKFLIVATAAVGLIYLVSDWMPYHVAQAGFFAVPLLFVAVIALAVLRYRLYDIDVVIRRQLEATVLAPPWI